MSKKRTFHRISPEPLGIVLRSIAILRISIPIRATRLLAALILGGLASSGQGLSQQPEGVQGAKEAQDAEARIVELVEQLGAASFQSREAALAELLATGPRALPTLDRLRATSDPEARKRIDFIRRRLAKDDLEARIDAFLSGSNDDLPGWKYARPHLGDERTSRELFVEITRRHPELATSLEQPPAERTVALERTAQKLLLTTQSVVSAQPIPADAIALLLVAGDEKTPASELSDAALLRLARHPDVLRGLSDTELKGPLRRLLGRWIPRVSKSRRVDALYLAMQLKLEEGLALARTALSDTDDVEALEFSLRTIARLGEPSDALRIKPLLDDQRAAGQGYAHSDPAGRPLRVVVGDVAMAAVATLNKRGLRDIGFPAAETHPTMAFDVDTLGFPVGPAGDEARQRVRQEIDSLVEAAEKAAEDAESKQ